MFLLGVNPQKHTSQIIPAKAELRAFEGASDMLMHIGEKYLAARNFATYLKTKFIFRKILFTNYSPILQTVNDIVET